MLIWPQLFKELLENLLDKSLSTGQTITQSFLVVRNHWVMLSNLWTILAWKGAAFSCIVRWKMINFVVGNRAIIPWLMLIFRKRELNSWRIIFEHRQAFSCYREQDEFVTGHIGFRFFNKYFLLSTIFLDYLRCFQHDLDCSIQGLLDIIQAWLHNNGRNL